VLLMRDAGRVVSRRSIVQELWGSLHDTKSLDVQVGRLRARLAAVEGRRRIVTVRGVGYRFLTDDDPLLPAAAVDEVEPETASIDLRVVVVADGSGDVELEDPQMLEGSASA
jgi:DNA-binding winged helix-turn-helix (wHTH) protein